MNNYEKFFQLHHQKEPFIIANAWNAKSAQIIENNEYDAIATSSANIPLSVDLERGYADNLAELNDNIQKLIDIGVVGINLEDAQGEEINLKKLNSIKNYLTKNNQKLFINARTDGFLQKLESPLERTLKRAKLYEDAGADGLFVTGVQDIALIKEITSSVTLPVNVAGVPKLSSIEALAKCGVRRISMAVFLYKATYNQLEKVVRDIKTEQSFAPLY